MAPTTPQILTQRHLNRALLARQLLAQRASASVPAVLEQMAGLQAQYAPAMYIGLWSRLEGFQRPILTRALERGEVVQGTLLRSTIHLVSPADYWPFAIAIREDRRAWWLRTSGQSTSAQEMEEVAREVRAHLRRESPRHRKDLDALVGKERSSGIGHWLDMVRVPPSGTWDRRRADLYAAAEDWIGPPPGDLGVETAMDHLVRRYLGAFGPTTAADIANWAGVRPVRVSEALARLDLRVLRAEDGAELVDPAGAPRPDPDTPAPVRFLPVWDATLLVHARRAGVLREEHRAKVFKTKRPFSVHTFLVDGQVAGVWWFDQGRIHLDPFEPLDPKAGREVADEAERLAAFLA